ncbi:hypothetical protein BJV82DRAFT_615307 [Fennellomyces sp. T-0311]|nr:hypothetical protein BJV82DRAFT_615307 [Fennellomyces sp. T-0311]
MTQHLVLHRADTTFSSPSRSVDKSRKRKAETPPVSDRTDMSRRLNDNTSSGRRRQRSSDTPPRWHSQSYLLFLALRQHPAKSLPRTDLIKAALALDEKISRERNIPRVFRGKTPTNSASAILTNNIDRYFIPFRPHGSRCMHFKLAYDPGNLKDAIWDYTEWESRLAKEEWPLYFGKRKAATPAGLTEFDAFLMARRQRQEDIDLKDVPKSWRDIVRVVDNQRVVAARPLPRNTPLGFYFGVPMTVDEFTSLKLGVGSASEYCVPYRNKTVLDPTDDDGQLHSASLVYCPFHYMRKRSDSSANVCLMEGPALNQVGCWTRRDIAEGEELVLLRTLPAGM